MANHKKKDDKSKSRLLFVEPNPCSENSQTYNVDREMVPTEDLSILVELESISRGRSVIIAGAKDEIQNSEGNSINTVSFIDGTKVGLGKKHLTTNYTQLRGLGIEPDDDLESLGIEHIAITFDTAYTPNVKIKFIDLRGKAVLEPGAKSKYAMFFELPYPIFKLRVKGFYGKSVTYCLHLIKWNASFNSTTGNFEINAEFIGYTYAMLTDCLMGLMRAVVCTDRGKALFLTYKSEEIEKNVLKYPGLKTIDEFLDYVTKVRDDFENIKTRSPAITQLNALDKVSDALTTIEKRANTLKGSLNPDVNMFASGGSLPDFLLAENTRSSLIGAISKNNFEDTTVVTSSTPFPTTITTDPGDVTLYKTDIQERLNGNDGINKLIEVPNLKINPSTKNKTDGVMRVKSSRFIFTETTKTYVVGKLMSTAGLLQPTAEEIYESIDILKLGMVVTNNNNVNRDPIELILYDFFFIYEEIKRVQDAIALRRTKLNDIILEQLRKVTSSSEYKFTIGNVVEMLSIHAQVLLETIGKVSELAEKSSQRETILKKQLTTTGMGITDKDTIFPWPEYKEKREKSKEKNSGYYETWIGGKLNSNQVDDVPEIRFTEEILKCLMLIGKADAQRELSLAGIVTPQFYPVTPLDATINYSDSITGKPLITNNPYHHALIGGVSTANPDEAVRLLLMRGFVSLGISNVGMDASMIEIAGQLEAENLFNVILTEFERDEVRNFSGIIGKLSEDKIIDKWEVGSSLVTNPKGASGTKRRMFYKTSSDKSLVYDYINEDGKAYIPISGQFDGRIFYNQSNGKMKKAQEIKPLSKDLLFIGNAQGYVGNAWLSTNPAVHAGAGYDDGAIYLKIMDESTYTKYRANVVFGEETTMKRYYNFVNEDLVFKQSSFPAPAYGVGLTLSTDAFNYYNGRHNTLEIEKIKYDNTKNIDKDFYTLNNSEKISNVECAYWNNDNYCFVGTYLSNNFEASYIGSVNNMRNKTTSGSENNVDGFLVESTGIRSEMNFFYGYSNGGAQSTVPFGRPKRYLIPPNYGKQRELLYDNPSNLLVPFIEYNVSHEWDGGEFAVAEGTQNFSLFGSLLYNLQGDKQYISNNFIDNKYEDEGKAFLFLNTFGWTGVIGDIIDSAPTLITTVGSNTYGVSLFDTWDNVNDSFKGEDETTTLKALFNNNASFIKAPRLWCAFIGSLLFRHQEYVKHNNDIIWWGGKTPKTNIFPWQDVESNLPGPAQYFYDVRAVRNTGTYNIGWTNWNGYYDPSPAGMNFAFSDGNSFRHDNSSTSYYPSIDRALIGLPQQVKDEFLKVFKDFATGDSVKDFPAIRKEYELFDNTSQQKTAWNDLITKINLPTDTEVKKIHAGEYFLKKSEIDRVFVGKENVVRNCYNISPIQDYKWSDTTAVTRYLYQFNTTYAPGKGNDLLVELIQEEYRIMNASPRSFRIPKPVYKDASGNEVEIIKYTPTSNTVANPNANIIKSTTGTEVINNWKASLSTINVKEADFRKYLGSFLGKFKDLFKDWTDNNDKKNDALQKRLFNAIDDDIIKLNIYRTLASINNKWVGTPSEKLGCSDISNISNTFKFLDSGFSDISDKFYINPNFLSKEIIGNYNQSFFDVVNNLLTNNNFNFIPLPSFINFKDEEELAKAFKPLPYKDALDDENVGPSFICVYIGQTSTNLDLGDDSTHKDDGIYIVNDGCGEISNEATVPKSFEGDTNNKSVNIPYFLVSYGKQNQSIFKDIKLDQREFVETAETLQIIEDISQTGDKRKPTFKGQNLFNVYQTRAYSAEVEMMGNATIQPMMYFQLNNVPMFRGAYMIISTSHDITAHNMTTKFKGVRIKETMTDLLTESELFMNLLGEIGTEGGGDIISNDGLNFAGRDVDGAEITKLGLGNPLTSMTITSAFGARAKSLTNPNASTNHKGIDLVATVGTPIYAPQDGIIEYVRIRGDFGLQMQIKHEQVNEKIWRTLYGHMSDVNPTILDLTTLTPTQIAEANGDGISIGQVISKGDIIGYTGGVPGANSKGGVDFAGVSQAAHLHFETRVEVKTNNAFNPSPTGAFYNSSAAKDPSALVAANFDGTLRWI